MLSNHNSYLAQGQGTDLQNQIIKYSPTEFFLKLSDIGTVTAMAERELKEI